jgi:predicted GIY-YIG superfamily endonuclease
VKTPFYVYVIELAPEVSTRSRFRRRNPRFRPGRRCAYVGSSVRPPDQRFDQHKEGYKANRYVRQFGTRLLPDLFERYNPIPSRGDALEIEEYLAERLRQEGWGVWQG